MKVDFPDRQRGYLGAVSSNLIWGIAPLYFSYLVLFPMAEIIAHRAYGQLCFCLSFAATGQVGTLAQGLSISSRPEPCAGAINGDGNWTSICMRLTPTSWFSQLWVIFFIR